MQSPFLQSLKPALLSAAFSSFQALNLHRLFAPGFSGLGVIFMMHRILPEQSHEAFAPHKYLSITPEFLAQAVDQLHALDIDIISIEEAYQRMQRQTPHSRKFAVLTFDDGFWDIAHYAYPLLKEKNAPFTVYIPSSWPDGNGFLYWSMVENIVANNNVVRNPLPHLPALLPSKTLEEKQQTFDLLISYFEALKTPETDTLLRSLLQDHNIDPTAFCKSEIMDWQHIRELNEDPLVTIGAHSVNHNNFHKLTTTELALELEQSRRDIEQQLQQPCQHFAYPFGDIKCIGDREQEAALQAGYKTAVTTRKGVIQQEHREHLTVLPRIHFHSDYQNKGYVSLVTSGFPFYILNKFRHHVAT